ncbi:MAG TPA: NCS2 family permease [Sedimentisphaerales bacterium]|jgi:AGZA family xanthine/uracil permease-like MFS transporter|nr:NCS2 family permease [Sedimentisphaerales bacterium]HNU31694.1 NCS2 family permease [Sedimentisphaerales bacterium]
MLRKYFEFEKHQTSLRVEVVAGVTTFLTMAYIIFVNPNILSDAGMDKNALIAVTCIVSAISTIAAGVFANAPIAMAPGMGLNSFFAYSLVAKEQVTWQTALGAVFISGLFFLVLTMIGLRKKLVEAIPPGLVSAIAVGIGLFIAFIGLGNLGLVLRDERTLFALGDLTKATVWIGLLGLVVMIVLGALRITGSLLIGIFFATMVSAVFGYVGKPAGWVSVDWPVGKLAMNLDIVGALKISLWGSIFTLMFIDLFDSIGTLVACCEKAGMRDERGQIRALDRLLGIDAAATMVGALFGTSTTTSYVESAAGIEQGGRTGLTSVVTGVLFLLAMLFMPVIAVVPGYATAPALIVVGYFMMKEARRINYRRVDELIPSLVIVVMIAVSYQISMGLALGFVSFVVLKVVVGRHKEIHGAMWIIAGLSIVFLAIRVF